MGGVLKRHVAKCDEVGEEQILDWRAGGLSVRQIRAALGIDRDSIPTGDGTAGGVRGLYRWLGAVPGRRQRWDDATRHAAEALNDEALAIADSGDNESVQRDTLRVNQRRYMAERMDPETFSKPQGGVTLNIGGLHLTAVQGVQAEMLAERERLRASGGAGSVAGGALAALPGRAAGMASRVAGMASRVAGMASRVAGMASSDSEPVNDKTQAVMLDETKLLQLDYSSLLD